MADAGLKLRTLRDRGAIELVSDRVFVDPPIADADGPYFEYATTWSGGFVQLDGTGSYDPNGGAITEYEWDLDLSVDSDYDGDPVNDVDATGPTPFELFPVGQTEISLIVTSEYGLTIEPDTAIVDVDYIHVEIDIKPGRYPNTINPRSRGAVPVAFLTTADFDAATIDPATITLYGEDFDGDLVKQRGKKNPVPMANLEDVDGDGDLDLIVHLDTQKLMDYELEDTCELGALTYDGFVVFGTDTIRIVPKK